MLHDNNNTIYYVAIETKLRSFDEKAADYMKAETIAHHKKVYGLQEETTFSKEKDLLQLENREPYSKWGKLNDIIKRLRSEVA